jgi:hypothetical protein
VIGVPLPRELLERLHAQRPLLCLARPQRAPGDNAQHPKRQALEMREIEQHIALGAVETLDRRQILETQPPQLAFGNLLGAGSTLRMFFRAGGPNTARAL